VTFSDDKISKMRRLLSIVELHFVEEKFKYGHELVCIIRRIFLHDLV
jgi:hypothetical protein